ncbi:hypothetical protein HaLaN_01340 [Haematococcus lacustris]|uniref:Uncharacterized protein n=1 Tax=Haematococcus lacustris TaxID=44745 RepID=A0A699YBG4_HAELA|nr:hypothetical protein HaLaN_01340 [Haematococcus lacustris]
MHTDIVHEQLLLGLGWLVSQPLVAQAPHWLVTLLAPGWAHQAVFHLPYWGLPVCTPGGLLKQARNPA